MLTRHLLEALLIVVFWKLEIVTTNQLYHAKSRPSLCKARLVDPRGSIALANYLAVRPGSRIDGGHFFPKQRVFRFRSEPKKGESRSLLLNRIDSALSGRCVEGEYSQELAIGAVD